MAVSGKIMFLGVLMAVLHLVATEGSVTVYNPAKILLDVLVDDKSVKVESDIISMDITQAEQKINITTAMGGLTSVDVKDGDVLVLLPEPLIGVGNTPAVKVVQVPNVSGDFYQAGVPPAEPYQYALPTPMEP